VKDINEACEWSAKKWGIFHTVNSFTGQTRKKENLREILSFSADMDGGDKVLILQRLAKFLKPTTLIETKNGFHAYWNAAYGTTAEDFEEIVGDRLVPLLGADHRAKDVSRLLRTPGFMHWKDPNDPFAIKLILEVDNENVYTAKEMREGFPLPQKEEKVSREKSSLRHELRFQKDGDLFNKIYSLNCEEALRRVSGSDAVSGEMFSFKTTSGNKSNILVNGKSTSCWIDENKRIGSADGGGPTIWQWVNWYQRDHKKTYELMKKYFPEIFA
jgi:hypothetical protein